ncbi:UNVERIFIED_CONTAM: hypothetical protein FKN15_004464 [Acipenser sinensis]
MAITGGEPGPAVVLGLALFSAAATRRFSPLHCSAAYTRAAADCQHLVPVCPVLKGEAAPAPLPRMVVEAKAAPAPPHLAAKAAGAPPFLAAKAAGAPPLLAVKAAGAPPLLAAKGKPAGMLHLLVETGPASTLPLLVAVGTAGLPSLLWVVEAGLAGTLPLLVAVETEAATAALLLPLEVMEVGPAGSLPSAGGDGHSSSSVHATTNHINSSSLNITWAKPSDNATRGLVTEYRINIHEEQTSNQFAPPVAYIKHLNTSLSLRIPYVQFVIHTM